MATNFINTAQNTYQTEVAALAHRHVTLSYLMIGIMALMITLMGFGGYMGLKSYQNALGHAEQVEAQYKADRTAWQQQMAVDAAERASLEKQIADRDKAANAKKNDVAKNTTDPIKALNNLDQAYHGSIDFSVGGGIPISAGNRLGFTIPQVNRFTQTKIDADAMAADLTDVKNEKVSLEADLEKSTKTLAECDNTVQAYKKAAKKSKWQKIVSGAKIGGAIALAALVGHAI